MTSIEIENALINIVIEKDKECGEKVSGLSENKRTEKKALMVEKGMYSLCLRAGLLYNNADEDRERAVGMKKQRLPRFFGCYPALSEFYQTSDEEEKTKLAAALYGEIWMESQFLRPYREELKSAEDSGDVRESFELKIKIEVLRSVLKEWKEWRKKNGLYPELPGEYLDEQ